MDADTEVLPAVRHRPVRFRVAGWIAFGVTLALNIASMAVPALIEHPLTNNRGEIQVYLDVVEEGNLPTWWSVGLLVVAAVAHVAVGFLARTRGARGAWAWFASGAMLAVLALDDHTALHERLDRIGREVVSFDGFPFYWLIPGAVAGLLVATALLLLAVRLSGVARWCMIAGCVLLLGAALGGEALQGLLLAADETGPRYVLTYHAEELGENIGVLLMLVAAARSVTITQVGHQVQLGYGGGRHPEPTAPARHRRVQPRRLTRHATADHRRHAPAAPGT
ncbi:hypothetical protein [Amycolatopsis suaedae]|uniref:hypothetical protein n=1 Tax=Amycolatopsis suaedae TaxID=2510978 RepID=UPI00196A557E|nr:hypothetical protein [Amycolatopsis suaedae]